MMGIPYAEVIGDPIAHSKSPAIHRFWLAKLGLDGDYRAVRQGAAELDAYFADRRVDPDWRGCNVAMPHKLAVAGLVNDVTRRVQVCEAVNVVTPSPDGMAGDNSDCVAVKRWLREARQEDDPKRVATHVCIVGSGGAARAAIAGAIEAGVGDFDIFSRSLARGREMAVGFGIPEHFVHPLDERVPIRGAMRAAEDQGSSLVIINATRLGMAGEGEVPVDLSSYYPDTVVMDFVYAPPDTRLVRQARSLGLRVVDGIDLLIEQASVAFEAFFARAAPRQFDHALKAMLTS